jgi:hypothetical protein
MTESEILLGRHMYLIQEKNKRNAFTRTKYKMWAGWRPPLRTVLRGRQNEACYKDPVLKKDQAVSRTKYKGRKRRHDRDDGQAKEMVEAV